MSDMFDTCIHKLCTRSIFVSLPTSFVCFSKCFCPFLTIACVVVCNSFCGGGGVGIAGLARPFLQPHPDR